MRGNGTLTLEIHLASLSEVDIQLKISIERQLWGYPNNRVGPRQPSKSKSWSLKSTTLCVRLLGTDRFKTAKEKKEASTISLLNKSKTIE